MDNWRKSSHSDGTGGQCVEVSTGWRKSTHSDGTGGACVETATGSGVVLVRDTTNRDGFTLSVPDTAWTAFLARL